MRGAVVLACVIVLGPCLALGGCTDDVQRGWTRALQVGDREGDVYDGPKYTVAFADRDANVCVHLDFELPRPEDTQEHDVDIRGSAVVVRGAFGGDYDPLCTPHDHPTSAPSVVSGKVEFDDFVNTLDRGRPCKISFDLDITQDPATYGGEGPVVTYHAATSDIPIVDEGCPRAPLYRGDYSELDAAWGEYQGLSTLIVSSWDDAREACVWARLIENSGAELPDNSVDAPGEWAYTGLRFALVEQAECVAENFVISPTNTGYASDSAGPGGASGSVRFTSTGADGRPCALDVDLSLRSRGAYEWTPDDVSMHASAVAVSGACD